MPNASARANARTLPDDIRLRRRLSVAVAMIIDYLNEFDALDEDIEDDEFEHDPAEAGIADDDGLVEQFTGEPSLGATVDDDQTVAWGADRFAASPTARRREPPTTFRPRWTFAGRPIGGPCRTRGRKAPRCCRPFAASARASDMAAADNDRLVALARELITEIRANGHDLGKFAFDGSLAFKIARDAPLTPIIDALGVDLRIYRAIFESPDRDWILAAALASIPGGAK